MTSAQRRSSCVGNGKSNKELRALQRRATFIASSAHLLSPTNELQQSSAESRTREQACRSCLALSRELRKATQFIIQQQHSRSRHLRRVTIRLSHIRRLGFMTCAMRLWKRFAAVPLLRSFQGQTYKLLSECWRMWQVHVAQDRACAAAALQLSHHTTMAEIRRRAARRMLLFVVKMHRTSSREALRRLQRHASFDAAMVKRAVRGRKRCCFAWWSNWTRHRRRKHIVLTRIRTVLMFRLERRCFGSWRDWTDARCTARARVRRTLARWQRSQLAFVMNRWRHMTARRRKGRRVLRTVCKRAEIRNKRSALLQLERHVRTQRWLARYHACNKRRCIAESWDYWKRATQITRLGRRAATRFLWRSMAQAFSSWRELASQRRRRSTALAKRLSVSRKRSVLRWSLKTWHAAYQTRHRVREALRRVFVAVESRYVRQQNLCLRVGFSRWTQWATWMYLARTVLKRTMRRAARRSLQKGMRKWCMVVLRARAKDEQEVVWMRWANDVVDSRLASERTQRSAGHRGDSIFLDHSLIPSPVGSPRSEVSGHERRRIPHRPISSPTPLGFEQTSRLFSLNGGGDRASRAHGGVSTRLLAMTHRTGICSSPYCRLPSCAARKRGDV